MDFSIFAAPETWITLTTLLFLELALGIDNLVFITITTERLPESKRKLGRKLGLAGALAMRVIFLMFASTLAHMTDPLFTIGSGSFAHSVSVRDLVLLIGGGYLVYKGIAELREMRLAPHGHANASHSQASLSLGRAVGTIMAMDMVFSIDSVITAIGLADQLAVIVIAVILSIALMMVFVDRISNFVNANPSIKTLALAFMTVVGALLVAESLGLGTGIEVISIDLEKLIAYIVLGVALIMQLLKIRSQASRA